MEVDENSQGNAVPGTGNDAQQLDEVLRALGIEWDQALEFFTPVVEKGLREIIEENLTPVLSGFDQMVAQKLEQIAAEYIEKELTPVLSGLTDRVDKIVLERIDAAVKDFTAKADEIFNGGAQTAQSGQFGGNGAVLQPRQGALNRLMANPEIADKWLDKILDKIFPSESADPLAGMEQTITKLNQMRQIVGSVTEPSGFTLEEVNRRAAEALAMGIRVGVNTKAGAMGGSAVPLAPQPAAISLNKPDGQSSSVNKPLSAFY